MVTGGTSGKGVILREKRSRKYRIKIFRSSLCFRENRLWILARYACTLSRLVITDLTVDRYPDRRYVDKHFQCDRSVFLPINLLSDFYRYPLSVPIGLPSYSNREYTNMTLSLGACNGNASAAADHYRHRYPNRRHPDIRVIQRAERVPSENSQSIFSKTTPQTKNFYSILSTSFFA